MSEDLNTLADALKQLQPVASPNRDAILYQAGRASAPSSWRWPLATMTTSVVALVFGAILLFRPATPSPAQIVYVPILTPTPAPPKHVPPESIPEPEPPARYVSRPDPWGITPRRHLENQVLRWGLHALPPLPPTTKPKELNKNEVFLDSL